MREPRNALIARMHSIASGAARQTMNISREPDSPLTMADHMATSSVVVQVQGMEQHLQALVRERLVEWLPDLHHAFGQLENECIQSAEDLALERDTQAQLLNHMTSVHQTNGDIAHLMDCTYQHRVLLGDEGAEASPSAGEADEVVGMMTPTS